MKDAICLMGPTASGKTDLAMAICDRLPCEIISVDSTMVYKQMDIGSAKPDKRLLKKYPHRLVDIRDPGSPYSVAEFLNDTTLAINEIKAKRKIPLLVGGSMLYFRVLNEGLANLPSANMAVRKKITKIAQKNGWSEVHRMLSEVDAESAKRLHPNDPQRLQRAMEVYMVEGKPLSEIHKEQKPHNEIACRFVNLAIAPSDRKTLHKHIETRCKKMFNNGLVDEVRQLYSRSDLSLDLPSVRSVGYRQVWQYLEGNIDEKYLVDKCIIATRQLAKRQMTWLRSWQELSWLESDSLTLVDDAIKIVEKDFKDMRQAKAECGPVKMMA